MGYSASASPLSGADPDHREDMMGQLQFGPATAEQCLDHYGRRIGESDEAMRYLAQRFLEERQPKEAQAWFEKAVLLERNKENLTALAEFHLARGEEEEWLSTMKRCLELPFNRKDEAQTNHAIAAHFIEKGEWEKALPYQEAAAMRGFYWAYNQAAWLNGALGNIQRGRELLEQEAYHNRGRHALTSYILAFDAEPTEWTHKLLDFIYEIQLAGPVGDRDHCARVALIRGDPDDAVSILERMLEETNDPWWGIRVALICEEQGWTERRDRILKDGVERYPNLRRPSLFQQNAKKLLDLYVEVGAAENLTPELQSKLLDLRAACAENQQVGNLALMGELFRLKGGGATAIEIYSEVITIKYKRAITDYIVCRGLRLLGEDPGAIMRGKHPAASQ